MKPRLRPSRALRGLLRSTSACAPALLALSTGAHADVSTLISETKFAHNSPVPLADFDEFGGALGRIGDLNGDGTDELVVGQPGDDTTGLNNGAVQILFMNPDSTVSTAATIVGGSNGQTNLAFGRAVCGLGDVDNDGVPDLAVGMLDAVEILLMLSTGQPHTIVHIEDGQAGFSGTPFDGFGESVAALRDWNGDGIPDLLVGAPGDDDGGTNHGAAYLLMLRRNGRVKAQVKLSSLSGGFTGALSDFDAFGGSVARIGDIDADGIDDLAIGAEGDDDGGSFAGAVWILRMNADGTVRTDTKISATAGGFTGSLDSGDAFGNAVARLGDLDGDGVPDLGVGAYGDDDGGFARGAFWTLLLASDGTAASSFKLSSTEGGLAGPLDDGDLFGGAAVTLGDLDGDGASEFAVSALDDDDGGQDRGAVYLFSRLPNVAGGIRTIGCGINPAGSLRTLGSPTLGGALLYLVDNPLGTQQPGALSILALSLQQASPCGVPISGWNMDPRQAQGELLVLPPFAQLLFGPAWMPGKASQFKIPVPFDPNLIGTRVAGQGALLETNPLTKTLRVALTEGNEVLLGTCP